MTDEEKISQIAKEINGHYSQTPKPWPHGDRFFDIEKLRDLIHRRPKPYEWYRRDLKRKRPNRKHGRNLYNGIQAYRQRVGQPVPSKSGLAFRGAARMYDHLRIKVLREHPEQAQRLPDLYTRYMYLRFPPEDFRLQVIGSPCANVCPSCKTVQPRARGFDFARYGIHDGIRIRIPSGNTMFVTPSTVTAGSDAITQSDTHDDAITSLAMTMLREDFKRNNK